MKDRTIFNNTNYMKSKCKRLIVNADGFGFGDGATQAIIDAISINSFIKSISINVNFPAAERAKEFRRCHSDISMGIHLNPLVGSPVLPADKVPTLIDSNGEFHKNSFFAKMIKHQINKTELEKELNAQIEYGKELAGPNLTHIDSQGNSNLFYFSLFIKLAKSHNIPCIRNNYPLICLETEKPSISRSKAYMNKPHVFLMHKLRKWQMNYAQRIGFKMADRLITVGYSSLRKTEIQTWCNIFSNLPEGTFEIYCHPGYPDDTLRRYSYYVEERKKEYEIVSIPQIVHLAQKANIELVSFFSILDDYE